MSLQETFETANVRAVAVGSLRRDAGGLDQFLGSLTEVYIRGVPLNWEAIFAGEHPQRVSLPTYVFQRQRDWLDTLTTSTDSIATPLEQADSSEFAQHLAQMSRAEQDQVLQDLLQSIGTTVLRHNIPNMVDMQRPFKDLGFDSLTSVEFRNRLNAMTGLSLSSALLYNYPTPAALIRHLRTEALGLQDEVAIFTKPSGTDDEPIVIVGMGCRYPGGVTSPEDLWQIIAEARSVVGPFPTDRGWETEGLYDPDPDAVGKSYARSGGFLYDAADFDAEFFGISPYEALAMDPQQRLLLETAWETFERAGIDPALLRGSQTGVFVGAIAQGYGPRLYEQPEDPQSLGGYLLTGTTDSIIAGRLAYTFGLQGPAFTVDTACSSSLVALHLAAQALRQGECSLALSGGITVMSTPNIFIGSSRQRAISPDGRCKAFAAVADGTGWSEGVGLVLLERLSDARRNGHQILALLRGSAINQDGASNGLTAPHGPAQQQVIRQALANARLTPSDVDVVEAHGTGTRLGDPIEAQAILATYGQDRAEDQPLWLGSLKSNIGHTQAAAGVGGVIKMVMAMHHGILPKTVHIDQPSSYVDWTAGSVSLLTQARPWPETSHPRRAGVSSFGMSGTNAHVILEQVLKSEATQSQGQAPRSIGGWQPWVISAQSETALHAQARQLQTFVTAHPDLTLTDIGFSLATTRSTFEHRAVVVARERDSFLDGLVALADGEPGGYVVQGSPHAPGKMAFLFTGQGSQRLRMGHELSQTYPVFARALDEVCTHLDTHLERPIREVLFASEGTAEAALLDQTAFTQPALFALEVALFRLLTHWGLVPDFLIGHSTGELVAAHVAGVLSLSDAAMLVVARSRLMQALPAGGAMVSLQASAAEVLAQLAGHERQVSIAALNGPRSTVIAGDEEAVLSMAAQFEVRGHKTRQLKVSHAFHSPRMDIMLSEFRQVARGLSFAPPNIPIVSNVTGTLVSTEQICSAEYWVQHVRQTVRFLDGIRFLEKAGVTAYIELGPDGVLTALAQECLSDETEQAAVVVPVLHSGQSEVQTLQIALAHAHTRGITLNWPAIFPGAQRVDLPTYPFQRQRYWLNPRSEPGHAASPGLTPTGHPFLGALLEQASGEGLLLTGELSLQSHPWLADHAVTGTPLLPGTAFVEIALTAGEQVGCDCVEELTIHTPLVLPEHGALQLQIAVGNSNDTRQRSLAIYSRQADSSQDKRWTQHAIGVLGTCDRTSPADLLVFPPATARPLEISGLYERLASLGYQYGLVFQELQAVWQDGETLYAQAQLSDEQANLASHFALHPALLDAILHCLSLSTSSEDSPRQIRLPFSWAGISLHATGATTIRARLSQRDQDTFMLTIADPTGMPVATIDALTVRPIPSHQLVTLASHDSLYHLNWITLSNVPTPTHRWAILGPDPLHLQQTLSAEQYADLTMFNESIASGTPVPDIVLVPCLTNPDDDIPTAVRRITHHVLQLIQAWLKSSHLRSSRLLFLTCRALALTPTDEPGDLSAAAIWGMVRTAQTEHPNTFVLVDIDAAPSSHLALTTALTIDEPQLAIRQGIVHVPRLSHFETTAKSDAPALDPDGTVLITGGTGSLGRLFACHLVAKRGVRHLLLTSRSGMSAEGAAQLASELTTQGANVQIIACDAADREALAQLLLSLPTEHPLTAVIHTAGVLDDTLIHTLSPQRIDAVLRPKVDAAWNLHQLTEHLNLSTFVLFSSLAGIVGNAGQANYASANTFLDALAQYRQSRGLPALSLAWGMWEQTRGMTSSLSQTDRMQAVRAGLAPLSEDEGLSLFDMARNVNKPLVVTAKLRVRTGPTEGEVAPALRHLLQVPSRRAVLSQTSPVETEGRPSWRERVSSLPTAERDRAVTELIRATVASTLGYASSVSIDINREFRALGFNSLSALQLRNRLKAVTGLKLPVTAVFDYPTLGTLINYLQTQLVSHQATSSQSVALDLDKPEATRATTMTNENKHRTNAPISPLSSIVCGSGPGLLLAHGSGGTAQSHFSALLDPLSECFTVVGPDYPGSGATPRATEPLLLDTLADQMMTTAVQAGVETFAVLGYSMGCAVALRAATRHPDRVTALILTAGFAQLDTVSRLKTEMLYGSIEREDQRARFQISLFMSRRYINSMSEEDLEELVDLVASRAAPGAAEQADLATRIDVRSDLPKVSVPTLVINMKEDQLVSPQMRRTLADGIPGAQVAELDCGHLPFDRYAEWQHLVLDFLTTVPAVTENIQ